MLLPIGLILMLKLSNKSDITKETTMKAALILGTFLFLATMALIENLM